MSLDARRRIQAVKRLGSISTAMVLVSLGVAVMLLKSLGASDLAATVLIFPAFAAFGYLSWQSTQRREAIMIEAFDQTLAMPGSLTQMSRGELAWMGRSVRRGVCFTPGDLSSLNWDFMTKAVFYAVEMDDGRLVTAWHYKTTFFKRDLGFYSGRVKSNGDRISPRESHDEMDQSLRAGEARRMMGGVFTEG